MFDYRRNDCGSPLRVKMEIDDLPILQVNLQVQRRVRAGAREPV